MYLSLPRLFVFLFDVLSVAVFVIRDRFVKKADLCLNLYPCVIKYSLSVSLSVSVCVSLCVSLSVCLCLCLSRTYARADAHFHCHYFGTAAQRQDVKSLRNGHYVNDCEMLSAAMVMRHGGNTWCLRMNDQNPPCESCLLYTSPSPRDMYKSRMPSSA